MSTASVCSVTVDPDLARRLTAAGRKAEEWKDRRDNLIREAARNGGSLREVASLVGLSNPGVLRIIRRGADLEKQHITPVPQGQRDRPRERQLHQSRPERLPQPRPGVVVTTTS